jgi:hypothetical protein
MFFNFIFSLVINILAIAEDAGIFIELKKYLVNYQYLIEFK